MVDRGIEVALLMVIAILSAVAIVLHEERAIENLSPEEQKLVKALEIKLRALSPGTLIEKEDGIFVVFGPEGMNAYKIQGQDDRVTFWRPPYNPQEAWKKIKRIVTKCDPEWREIAEKFYFP